jgi:iron complex outermembrane receptor protein
MGSYQQVIFGGASNLPNRNFRKDKAYAPYGQATWTPPILGDKLSLTVGLRYTQEQIHMDHIFGKAVDPKSTAPGFTNVGGKAFGGSDALSPTGSISYQWTDDLMTYFRVSRGYTSGTFNDTGAVPELFRVVKPETLWSLEAGFKSQWLNNRLRVNAAGFFSYYQNLQRNVFRSSPTLGETLIVSNVDTAEIWGTEFEGTAIPFRGLEATVSYSFLAPKYTKWFDHKFDAAGKPLFDNAGNPITESVADQRSWPYFPQHQANGGLTYTAPPTTTGTFSAHLEVSWLDKMTFITNNLTGGSQADEGWAYAVVNGRLAYTGIPLQKGSLDIAVFGRNLLDRKYRTFGVDFGSGLGVSTNSYGDPRTFGLQLIYNFSES